MASGVVSILCQVPPIPRTRKYPLTSIADCNIIIPNCNMRDALILLVFSALCYPKLLAQQPLAGMEGTVVHSITGAPLRGVHLRLALQNPDEVVAPIYGAMSDDAGRFSIAGIQPGVEYRLEAERAGLIPYPTV